LTTVQHGCAAASPTRDAHRESLRDDVDLRTRSTTDGAGRKSSGLAVWDGNHRDHHRDDRTLDAEEASRRIELHVGRDLQFIRINGTVVGALAGW